jgi:uncharacterized protein YkwD
MRRYRATQPAAPFCATWRGCTLVNPCKILGTAARSGAQTCMNTRLVYTSLALCALLAGCGGGGDSGSAAPAAAAPNPTPVPAPVGAPPPANKTCGQANFQADILAAVNAARASGYVCASGAKPAAAALAWNDVLFDAAAAHSQDMAANMKTLSHTGSDGSNVGQRVTRAGYSWSGVGENIAVNYANATSVVDGWLKSSSGHCDNIMNARYSQFAVACVNGQWGSVSNAPYYTMVLATPR